MHKTPISDPKSERETRTTESQLSVTTFLLISPPLPYFGRSFRIMVSTYCFPPISKYMSFAWRNPFFS